MYSMKSYVKSEKIDLPDCMYHMKLIDAFNKNINSFITDFNGEEDFSKLVLKQQDLTRRLMKMKTEIENIKQNKLNLNVTKNPQVKTEGNELIDIVICLNPTCFSTPMLVNIIIEYITRRNCSVFRRDFIHSSCYNNNNKNALSKLENLTKLINVGIDSNIKRGFYQFGITIIWKIEGLLPSLMISPINQVKVVGEKAIIKYLFNSFLSCREEERDIISYSLIDDFIDQAELFREKAAVKEQEAYLKLLDSKLSSNGSSWLVGKDITLADITNWFVIKSRKQTMLATDYLSKWMQRCEVEIKPDFIF